jgi:hypothetical protein
MIIRLIIISIIIFILNISCVSKPDIGSVDSLISIGQYSEALDILKKSQYIGGLEPKEKQRIIARILKVERFIFFQDLKNYIENQDWSAAAACADSIKKQIDKMDIKRFESYSFDFYYQKAKIDSVQAGREKWRTTLATALNFYTPDYEKEQYIHECLAFYFAEKDELVKAREQMDKSIRKLSVSKMNPDLKEVFHLYMEGQFSNAYEKLISINKDLKNERWKSLELFLEKYHNSLTLKDRYKLW